MITSVIPRLGGKSYLCNWIVEKIPENHAVFVEVFAGSCVISLNKRSCETTIVNDLDSHLITFWRVLQDGNKRKRLIAFLDNMLYSRTLWRELRERWKSGSIPSDPVEASAEWFYLNRSSYASDVQYGGFIGYTQGRNMCRTFRNAVNQLDEVGEMIRTWIIENLDFKTCITRFDSPETVFYADAPYFLPGKRDCYSHSFTLDDHRTLAGLLNNIRGWALVSHYKDTTIAGLYSGWNCHEFQSFKGSHKAASGESKPATTEILYTNFEPVKNRSLFDAME